MDAMSASLYVENHVKLASEWLKDHVILHHEQNDRVGIVEVGNRNGSNIHRCELMLAMHSGHLVLTGDHDTICWGRYRGGHGVVGAIAWIARDGVFGYVREKASIGMGQVGVEEWKAEVAFYEAVGNLREAQKELDEDRDQAGIVPDGHDDHLTSEVDLWNEVIKLIRNGHHQQDVIERIAHHDCDCERLDLGMVPSQRLLWGWSIVRKADELLTKAEDTKGG